MSNKTDGGAGNGWSGVSLTARNESNGTRCALQTATIAPVSISTAAAPELRAISFRSEIESRMDVEVKSFMRRGWRSDKIRPALTSNPGSEKFRSEERRVG